VVSVNADEKSLREMIDLWHRATAKGDIETVLALVARDAIFLTPGNPPVEGRSAFETGLRKVLQSYRIESSAEVHEAGIDGDLAYCLTFLTVRMTPHAGGDTTVRSGHALTIFKKDARGSWVLFRDANLLPPK
jgi:uncharacterized protein (TIGR02246 family)